MVYPDRAVNITVVVKNIGDTVETFNVTVYYNNHTLETQTVYGLPPRVDWDLIFVFNTTGLESCNNYTISAIAHPVPYEVNTTNNFLSDGWIKIKIWGDINGDGIVNIYDIVLASDAYGSTEGDPDYVPDADLAPAWGLVDIYDLVTIASFYGDSCPP